MTNTKSPDIEQSIAGCRVIFSVIALVAMSVTPTWPAALRWLALPAGASAIDPRTFGVMCMHLAYSVAVYYSLTHHLFAPARLATFTAGSDTLFAAVIAVCTEAASSPFYAFFIFALLAAGFQSGLRRTLVVTGFCVALYLGLIALSGEHQTVYITRPAYLGIIGYLVGYLGQRRLDLEAELAAAEASKERERIARDLHDGCIQTLAAVNLRLAACRDLVQRDRNPEALTDLAMLQRSITGEYDNLRAYMRTLAGLETSRVSRAQGAPTQFAVSAEFGGSGKLVEQVLQIMREGVVNVRRHAEAASAAIRVRADGLQVLITIDDDGIGLPDGAARPWSMLSRVSDLGGEIRVVRDDSPGAHLTIALPRASGS